MATQSGKEVESASPLRSIFRDIGSFCEKRARVLKVFAFFSFYFFTRLYNLTLAGMYFDEPLYLYWGQVIGSDWNQRFMGAIYLSRQPLHTWFVAASERLFADPVFAGRLVSVVAGAFTLVAMWLLARRLFSARVAAISVLLYTLVPYTLHFDRTALTDSLLCAENLWMLYMSVRLLDHLDALSTGGVAVSFAMALLTKSYGRAFPLLLPVVLLWKKPGELTFRTAVNWTARLSIALIAGFSIYYAVFGSTEYANVIDSGDIGTLGFIMPLSFLLTFPWDRWLANLTSVIQWFTELTTIPVSIIGVLAMIFSFRFGVRAVSLSAMVLLPIAGSIIVANVFYDRYILYTIPPFLILAALFLDRTYEFLLARRILSARKLLHWPLPKVLAIAGVGLILIPSVRHDSVVLTDFETANVFAVGYYGINSASQYLADEAKGHPVCVITNDLSRPAADGPAVLLRGAPNISFFRVKPDFGGSGLLVITEPGTGSVVPKDFFATQDVYYVFEVGVQEENWLEGRIDLEQSFPNLKGDDSAIGLYRIRFDDSFK